MIAVERSEREATAEAPQTFLASLDTQPGAWLGCDVEAEGLFAREGTGCADPALGFFLDGNELRVLAFTPIGHALLQHVRRLASFEACKGGLRSRFGTNESVVDVLRTFLALFRPAYRELALFGVFSFDYYRLGTGQFLPDDGRRRMVLYFGNRVLVSQSERHRWVEFSFPGLVPTVGPAAAVIEATARPNATEDPPRGEHAMRVAKGIDRLRSGELFSLVLSQTFQRRAVVKASHAFNALRALNPYPAMFFLNLGGGERLFGASPDLQVRADRDLVESAPVCGTYRRGADPVADNDQAKALLDSDKEDASLAACADADRNDKAKVCEPGSVEVVSHRRVHFFSTIIHTIAHTRGKRGSTADVFDILLAHATPATVTGLPKHAAVAAIEQIEASPRGWYAGAVARLATDGSMEALTVLRAARMVGDIAEVRTGGNLLVDSDPAKEEEETRLKAETLFRVLAGDSPRPPGGARTFERSFEVSFHDGDDPMGTLLRECLTTVGCEILSRGKGAIDVASQWPFPTSGRALQNRPLLVIGTAALRLLDAENVHLTTLPDPRYGRRISALGTGLGFYAQADPLDLGLYANQVVERHKLSTEWLPSVVTTEGWVLAASAINTPKVALFFRPDSVQSMKNDAGRMVLRRALEWLSAWKAPV
jgi:anthranilate/para-aminobenzoate synthase component I